MEANQIFTNLLSDIEKSGLNYFISRTPISANISLQTSFTKHFNQESHQTNFQKREAPDILVKEDKEKDLEILTLGEKITTLEKLIVDQKAFIEGKLEAEKKLKNSNEEKSAEFRADLLKVKSERNKLNSALKAAETEIDKSQETNQTLLNENENLKCQLNELNNLMKSKDSEIAAYARENSNLNHKIENLQVEVTANMAKHEKDTQSLQKNFQCHLCDQSVGGHLQMKLHVREKHCSEFGNQTELANDENQATFEEFLCFYCEILIQDREVLEMHGSECHPIPLTDFPCDNCGLQCLSQEQLELHKSSYHTKESYLNDARGLSNNENLKSCDFCGIKFGTLGGLRSHIRSLHKEMLPI